MLKNQLRPALVMTAVLCLVTGFVYPGLVTAVAQVLFPAQANGSLLERNSQVIGSALIGQAFTSDAYFHGRPSAAGDGYNASASSGSNKGPTDSTLRALVAKRVDSAVAGGATRGQIPADLVTASASGLDPHISPASADMQVDRVAKARGVSPATIRTVLARHVEARQFGLLGEPRVNVLQLNLAVDSAYRPRRGAIR